MYRKLICSILFLVLAHLIAAQARYSCVFDKKTEIEIHGTSNITAFTFSQNGKEFLKNDINITLQKRGTAIRINENQLEIPVNKFTSTNKPALLDFRKMMQSSKYPSIRITLQNIEVQADFKYNTPIQAKALAVIEITNIKQSYTIPFSVYVTKNTISVSGNKQIDITDFDLTTPEHLFGLIKVSNNINIQLTINCSYKAA